MFCESDSHNCGEIIMFDHLIRQEKQGGYWLIRDEGRAVELNDQAYNFMASLFAARNKKPEFFTQHLSREPIDSLMPQFKKYQLTEQSTWQKVRHVASDVPLVSLSHDAVIAPKRIYFEITRHCNLACRSCFNNSHHALPNELTFEEIIDVNRQAEKLGVF